MKEAGYGTSVFLAAWRAMADRERAAIARAVGAQPYSGDVLATVWAAGALAGTLAEDHALLALLQVPEGSTNL